MLDLGQGILEEFVERVNPDKDSENWKLAGLSVHNPPNSKEYKKEYDFANRDKINARRRAMRKLNPGYGR